MRRRWRPKSHPFQTTAIRLRFAGDRGKFDSCSLAKCLRWRSVTLRRDRRSPNCPGRLLRLEADPGTATLARAYRQGVVEGFRSFVGERGDILESGAKESGRDPTGEGEYPARFGRDSGIENISVETEHAATRGFALGVDGKQKCIWPGLHVEGRGGVVVGVDVVDGLVEKQEVKEQVQQLDELRSVRSPANKVRLHGYDAAIR